MGKMADKATRQAEEQAAALLSEPLLGIGMVNRCGVMGTIAANTALDIADAFLPGELPGGIVASDHIFRDGQKLAKIPLAFMFAVTASSVHVFEFKAFMGNIKVKNEIAAFDRAGLELASEEGTLVITFRMVAPQQRQVMMFEIMKSDYAREFGSLLRSG